MAKKKKIIKIIIQNKYNFQKFMFLRGIILLSQYLNTSQKKDKIKITCQQIVHIGHLYIICKLIHMCIY